MMQIAKTASMVSSIPPMSPESRRFLIIFISSIMAVAQKRKLPTENKYGRSNVFFFTTLHITTTGNNNVNII